MPSSFASYVGEGTAGCLLRYHVSESQEVGSQPDLHRNTLAWDRLRAPPTAACLSGCVVGSAMGSDGSAAIPTIQTNKQREVLLDQTSTPRAKLPGPHEELVFGKLCLNHGAFLHPPR